MSSDETRDQRQQAEQGAEGHRAASREGSGDVFTADEEPGSGPVVSEDPKRTDSPWQKRTSPASYNERIQGRIVTAALILLATVVIAATIKWVADPLVDLAAFAQFVIAPVAGIVSGAIGYYFGRTSKGRPGS